MHAHGSSGVVLELARSCQDVAATARGLLLAPRRHELLRECDGRSRANRRGRPRKRLRLRLQLPRARSAFSALAGTG